MKKLLTIILCTAGLISESSAQTAGGLTNDEYKKALWMTTRMYGGQRSGENNWYVHNYLPAGMDEKYRGKTFIDDKDGTYDLSGGWHDCGDHVKFGQTQFYSGYILLKGYAEFPAGYGDYYTFDYKGYKTAGKWNWEDNAHDPNNIPDVIEEVKHATDFYIKCAKDATTFYYQVGQGTPDHAHWETAVKMQTRPKGEGGQPREIYKNPNDASMASFCGAALALMSRVYKNYDPAYAATCLQHAKYAYAYAKAHPGTVGAGDNSFYGKNANWKDDYATMLCELYWATEDEAYKTEALAFKVAPENASAGQPAVDIYGNSWGFDYENNGEIALYNLALLGSTKADSSFKVRYEDIIKSVNTTGLFTKGNTGWGPLRYNANAAWLIALGQKLYRRSNVVPKFVYDNIDWLLGKNASNQSFVVGFGAKSPSFPHHRTIYRTDSGSDTNPGQIPASNKQSGLLVGGTRNLPYNDSPSNYAQSEGGIDYNAGLVGALGFINSVTAPVDGGKFQPFKQIEVPGTLANIDESDFYADKVIIYPNPSSQNFTIATEYPLQVKIFNALGSVVGEFSTPQHKVFGEQLPSGVYHVSIMKDGKLIKTVNVMKN